MWFAVRCQLSSAKVGLTCKWWWDCDGQTAAELQEEERGLKIDMRNNGGSC